jgi:hypothetical protein
MERRTFLKNTGLAGLFTLITPSSIIHSFTHPAFGSLLDDGFLNPSRRFAPFTWWHWMNGNISKEGITLDLEAMKGIGLGGFQLFDAGTGIVKGPVEYLSESWFTLMKHTISESQRLELEFAMHNCPGWSSSGGPWITPELSMQQLVWSETAIKGGKQVSVQLPRPVALMDFYQDSRIIAFPAKGAEAKTLKDLIKTVKVNSRPVSIDLIDGTHHDGLTVKQQSNDGYGLLELEFFEPISLSGLLVFTSRLADPHSKPTDFIIEISSDGQQFFKIADFMGGQNNFDSDGDTPAYANFEKAKAAFIRICSGETRHYSNLQLRDASQSQNWLRKAFFRGSGWQGDSKVSDNSTDYIASNSVLDITEFVDANGLLTWKAPKGNWRIVRLGHTTTKQYNHSAPTTGTGLECDKFSKEALDFHFNKMFEKLLPQFKAMGKDAKVGLLIDSYEMSEQNWTSKMVEEFQKMRNYSIIGFLPALTGRIVDSTDSTNRFLWDFKRTCSDLMAENYYDHFNMLCQNNGIESYTEPYGGQFEEMQVGSKISNNMGEFWVGLTGLWDNRDARRTIKLASSIAHTNGQKIIGAEAYTSEPGSGKWQQHPYSMKSLGDWMYTLGLNRVIFHRYAHQPHPTAVPGMTMGPWGIHFERTNTWWSAGKAWIRYQTRIQSILQQGTFIADVAYLATEEPGHSVRTMRGQLSHEIPYGFDYDFMAPETLMKASMSNAELILDDGMKYKVLVLSNEENMILSRLMQIEKLLQDGLVLLGRKPLRNPSLLQNKEQEGLFEELTTKIWGDSQTEKLEGKSYGKGKVYANISLAKVLEQLNIQPDFQFTSASSDAPINYIHKKIEQTDFYFIANKRRSEEKLVCTFRITDRVPEFWDPDNGMTVDAALYQIEGNRMKVFIDLPPVGSVFVAFRKKAVKPSIKSVYKEKKVLAELLDFPLEKPVLFEDVVNTFCISLWVKPEVDAFLTKDAFFGRTKTDYYAIFPFHGQKLFGKGHATVGLTAGRNGMVLFERETDEIIDVLSVKTPLSGWSHIAVEYLNGIPKLYLNGVLTGEGTASGKKVHHGIGKVIEDYEVNFFNGDSVPPALVESPFSLAKIIDIVSAGPNLKQLASSTLSLTAGNRIVFGQNGSYTISHYDGTEKTLKVDTAGELLNLDTNWTVSFPPKLGAPNSITLPILSSLHTNGLEGVKYFSGTASYKKSFELKHYQPLDNRRLFLDLGKVEVIAEVFLNSKSLGIVWKPPYRVEITEHLQKGTNTMEIHVTNLWPNRLIGDEQLPIENKYLKEENIHKFEVLGSGAILELPSWYKDGLEKPDGGRVTFSTWHHYHKESPLLESGLIGPVSITAVICEKA